MSISASDYSFDHEEEASSSLLLRFFSNNLYLGQWELARASVDELRASGGTAGSLVNQLLLACTRGLLTTGRSDSVPNVHAHAWLALKEFERLNGKDENITKSERETELRLLLLGVSQYVPATYAAELCEFISHDGDHSRSVLSEQCLEVLQKVLRLQPASGTRLLELVFSRPPADRRCQQVVLGTMGSVLDDLMACALDDIRQIELLNKTFYDLLTSLSSLAEDSALALRRDPAYAQTFRRITAMMATESRLAIGHGAVYGALLGSAKGELLSYFCEVEEEECLVAPLSPHRLAVTCSALTSSGNHTGFLRWRQWARKTLVLRADFLTSILERSQQLAKEKRYAELGRLMNTDEMSMVAPMALQTAWCYAESGDDCRSLIEAFAEVQRSSQPVSALVDRLRFQAGVIDWCSESVRLKAMSSRRVQQSPMFNDARLRTELSAALLSGSLLRALCMCGVLSMLDEDDVCRFLDNQPVPQPAALPTDSSRRATDAAAQKTVRFREDSSTSFQQHELSLFLAFCALKRFADVVLQGSRLAAGQLEACVEQARKILSRVRPFTLYLETMENVFALLFACGDDVDDDSDNSPINSNSEEDLPDDRHQARAEDSDNAVRSSQHKDCRDSLAPRGTSGNSSDRSSSGSAWSASTGGSAGTRTTGSSSMVDGTRRSGGTASEDRVHQQSSPAPGFLADAAVVKCILHALKRSVDELCGSSGPSDRTAADAAASIHASTVDVDDYGRRLSWLQKCINEARWRYQIAVEHQTATAVAVGTGTNSDDEMERIVAGERSSKNSCVKQDMPRNGVVTQQRHGKQGMSGSRRASRCIRKTTVRPQALWKESAMSVMLATPATMLVRCMLKGQTVQAKHVVQNCLADDCALARELVFGERYSSALQRLMAPKGVPSKGCDSLAARRGGTSLPLAAGGRGLGELAAAMAADASSVTVADELLSSCPLPDMAVDWQVKDVQTSMSVFAQSVGASSEDAALRSHIRNHLVPACVLLDLAVSGCYDAKQCRSYLESAVKRLPGGGTATSEWVLQGAAGFLRKCYSLMGCITPSLYEHGAVIHFVLGVPELSAQLSLPTILLSHSVPLDCTDFSEYLEAGLELEKCEHQLEATVATTEAKDGLGHLEDGGDRRRAGPRAPIFNLAVEQAARAASKFGAFLSSRIGQVNQQDTRYSTSARLQSEPDGSTYLLCMYSHCRALKSLTDDQTKRDRDGSNEGNCFGILKQSPTLIMGRLIFERCIPPARLEPDAMKLKLDLPRIIVRSCCQPIACKVPHTVRHYSTVAKSLVIEDGILLLNANTSGGDVGAYVEHAALSAAMDPLQLAADLLSRMMAVVQAAILKDEGSDGCTLRRSTAVQLHSGSEGFTAVASACSELSNISLSSLKNDEHKVCFFVNVLNLMYLHGYIHCTAVQCEPPEDKIGFVAYSSSIAYSIGELGVISAFELEHLVLRCGLPSELFGIKLSDCDPWRTYTTRSVPDWRLAFLVNHGRVNSRQLRVVHPQELQSLLVTEGALGISLGVKVVDRHVEISEDLVQYVQDAAGGASADDAAAAYEGPYAALLRSLCSAVDAATRERIEAVLAGIEHGPPGTPGSSAEESATGSRGPSTATVDLACPGSGSASVVVVPCAFESGYVFGSAKRSTSLSLSFSMTSLGSEPSESDSHALSTAAAQLTRCDSQLLRRQPDFVLSADAMHYLYDRAPVVAVLVDLLCLDRDQRPSGEQLSPAAAAVSCPCLATHIELHTLPLVRAALALSDAGPAASPDEGQGRRLHDLDTAARVPEAAAALRAAALAHRADPALAQLVHLVMTRLFERRQFSALLRLLCLHERISAASAGWQQEWWQSHQLKDYVLMRLACESYSRQSCDYTRQIRSTSLQARVILACLGSWPASVGVDMLRLSQQRLQQALAKLLLAAGACPAAAAAAAAVCASRALLRSVRCALEDMLVYQRVMEHASNQLSAGGNQLAATAEAKDATDKEPGFVSPSAQFLRLLTKGWQNVREAVVNQTELVLQTLYAASDFESAVKIAQRQPGDHGQSAYENYLVFLLRADKPDFERAEKLLEDVLAEDGNRCYAVGEGALKRLCSQECLLFVTRFLLRRLCGLLGPRQRQRLNATRLGAKVLLQLPERARMQCSLLVSSPTLMLEQLVMNSQVEWARTAIQVLRASTETPGDAGDCPCDVSAEAIDQLIEKYAEKALDYQLVFAEDHSAAAAGGVALALAQSKRMPPPPISKLTSGSPSGTATAPMTLKSVASSSTLSPTGASAPKTDLLRRIGSSVFGASAVASSGSSSLPSSAPLGQGALLAKKPFIIPDEPPPKELWVDDSEAAECMICKIERFSMFNRRHHCRRCGRVVCGSCSSKTAQVNTIMSRVCDECFELMQRQRDISPGHEKMRRIVERLSGNLSSGSPPMADSPVAGFPDGAEVTVTTRNAEQEWMLTLDEKCNQTIRDEFYYDFAPSTSLCVSLLDLHSDMRRSGMKMLSLCDSQLAKLLVPLKPGQENKEVDYSWVVSMMQFLIFNAKVRFAKCFDVEGQGSCDLYSSRVDILDLLVNANCRDIPAMQELSKMDSLRRLRDRLVEDERPTLAMEVSTKSGLDPSGAWAAWGFACLKSGDYMEARDKFSRCLKVPIDLNQQQQQSSKLVNDIIATIESSQCSAVTNVQALMSTIQDVKALIAEPSAPLQGLALDDGRMQECLYYLKTYGSHFSLVDFYRKNGFLQKAVQYILDKVCSADVFVESLLMPTLTEGEFKLLQDNLLMVDSSLDRWAPYLLAACRHLDRHGYVNVLYEMQLFMKDYIRAAMTCIRQLYQRGAKTYSDLYQRLVHLEKARIHLKDYLDPRQWGTFSKPPLGFAVTKLGSSSDSRPGGNVVLIQKPDEVNRHINTVALQMEVTRFMHQHADKAGSVVAGSVANLQAGPHEASGAGSSEEDRVDRAAATAVVPTLFGNNQMRAALAAAVMSATGNPNDGFGLAFRIVQDYALDYARICTQVARTLALRHNYTGVRQLLDCIRESGLKASGLHDDVVIAALRVIAGDEQQAKEADSLIKLISSDIKKIEANVMCGRLKSAYLVAVKTERVSDVQRIASAARQAGQASVAAICEKWLKSRTSS